MQIVRSRRVLAIGVVALLGFTVRASAEVTKAERKCRASIATQAKTLIAKGLKSLDKCHAKRDKGKFDGDCNAVNLATPAAAFASKIAKQCKAGNPILQYYPGDNPGIAVPAAVGEALAASGAAVQGSPSLGGDRTKAKCHGAIGKGRSGVVNEALKGAVKCQTANDKTAQVLVPFAASNCIVSAGKAGGKATGSIAKACGATPGADVGSCDPLGGCVVDSGIGTAGTLAAEIYGELAVCGNGARESDEECDDGNTADGDECTHDCKAASCGDAVVSAGEDCDDGNNDNTDACTRICSGPDNSPPCVCRAARCGDGFVQAGEQCDDGNDTANDGCGACQLEPTPCTPGTGVEVTVAVDFDKVSRDLRGVELNLSYPGNVSIPGHFEETTVQDRIFDAACRCEDPGEVFPACTTPVCVGFLWTGNDSDTNSNGVDDRLRVVYGAAANVPEPEDVPAPIVKIRFDCETQSFLQAGNFTCAVTAATDPDGVEIPGQETCSVSLSVPTP